MGREEWGRGGVGWGGLGRQCLLLQRRSCRQEGSHCCGPRCVRMHAWQAYEHTVPVFLCAPKSGPCPRGGPGLCLFAGNTSWLPREELSWSKNELIWGHNSVRFCNTKIDLFLWPFYSTHNGITRPLFLSLSNNNDAINILLGSSLFEGREV